MPSSKRKYVAGGLIAAGAATAVAAYAVRRRRDKAVDKELAGMLNQAEAPAEPAPQAGAPALSGARTRPEDAGAALDDVLGAMPAVEPKPTA